MDKFEWEDLGVRIQDMIEKAVKSQDYKKLNKSVGEAVNKTLSQIRQESIKTVPRQAESYPNVNAYKKPPNFYAYLTGEKVKCILQTVFGGILTGSMGLGLLVILVLEIFLKESAISLLGPFVFLGCAFVVGSVLLWKGSRGLGLLARFKKYTRTLGKNTYCDLQELSRAVGKPLKFVKKDIKCMISKGWFLEGHVDKQETCLITSNETYKQYEQVQSQLEQRQRAEQLKSEEKQDNIEGLPQEVRDILRRGNLYLDKIRMSNEAIQGEVISAKISKMETIVRQILERAEEHPEIIPDLKKLMDYYLPMTVKLLDAYEDMDSQPVQGTNIHSSKKEIEATLDTLNDAFTILLDSIFKDAAWDVSSDITVLHTMLAQEGLTKNDFTL